MISSRYSILSPIYLIIYLSYLIEDRCFNPLFNQTWLTSALQHHLQLNFKFSQSPEKLFKTLLCCLIFFTQRYKKLVITSRANLWPKGLFYARFRRLLFVCASWIEVAWRQDTILRTPVLFLKELMIQLQQAIPRRSAEPLAMFLFLRYTMCIHLKFAEKHDYYCFIFKEK